MQTIRQILSSHLDETRYEYGFADLRGLLNPQFAAYSYGIAIVRRLDDAVLDAIVHGPTREYFEHYHAVNRELNEGVARLAAELSAQGFPCQAVTSTVDDRNIQGTFSQTLTYVLSHKMVATRAGLGWIGKTDLLISKRFGSRVRLASILTSHPLETATPVVEGQCGVCTVCVDQCPAEAASGGTWRVGVPREAFFDAFRCRTYCRAISKEKLDEDISLCGKCVSLCPKSSRNRRSSV